MADLVWPGASWGGLFIRRQVRHTCSSSNYLRQYVICPTSLARYLLALSTQINPVWHGASRGGLFLRRQVRSSLYTMRRQRATCIYGFGLTRHVRFLRVLFPTCLPSIVVPRFYRASSRKLQCLDSISEFPKHTAFAGAHTIKHYRVELSAPLCLASSP